MGFLLENFWILMLMIALTTYCIFLIGDQLAFYADQLSLVSGISGAFIGFVLIAIITSTPEMVGSFVSSSKGLYALSAGGVLGSNAVNIAILCLIFLIFKDKNMKIQKNSIFSFLSSLILLSAVGIILIVYPISQIIPNKYFIAVAFLIVYIFIMYHAYQLSDEGDSSNKEKTTILPLWQILVGFVIFSMGIIGVAWFLIFICQQLSMVSVPFYGKPLGEHFIGTLILAFATSTPELATSFQMVRRNLVNMAVENMAGSNILNIIILMFSSFFAKGDFWTQIPLTSMYTIFIIFIISLLFCIVSLIKETKRVTRAIYYFIVLLWLYSLWIVF